MKSEQRRPSVDESLFDHQSSSESDSSVKDPDVDSIQLYRTSLEDVAVQSVIKN